MDYVSPTHQEVLDVVQRSNFVVIVDDHRVCGNNKYDGYTILSKNKLNESGKNEFVICVKSIQKNYQDWEGELERTIAHEAVHVAQLCKSTDGLIRPLGFRKNIEEEAFAVQDQPREILRILKKYCL